MPLDAPSFALLEEMSKLRAKPLHQMTPSEARQFDRELQGPSAVGPQMFSVEDVIIQSSFGAFCARVLLPQSMPCGVMVYYHGGGWVLGELAKFDRLARLLADATHCAVVLVDYRLAPEHPFPVPVEDSYAALHWVDQQMEAIAGRRVPLFVAGDSAGGNLAAVVARRARDNWGPVIAAQILVYPVTDCDFETCTYLEPDCQRSLTRDAMLWFWSHYLPSAPLRTHPDASPLRARNLQVMPRVISR